MTQSIRVLAAAIALVGASEARAGSIGSDHPFGLGIALGAPSAITGKYYLGGDVNALEFQVGAYGDWNNTAYDTFYAHVVYLWHPSLLASGGNVEVPWHIGVGGALWDGPYGYCGFGDCFGSDDVALAVRVPVGIDVNLGDPRFQFFGDVAANILVFPGVDIGLGLQIGARYYF